MDNTLSPSAIKSTILAADYPASITNTHLGIDAAISQFTTYPRAVPRNLVILTDGQSSDPPLTLTSAANAAAENIRTFTVGIGDGVDHVELNAISNGLENRVYWTSSFDSLVELLNPLSRALCAN